MQRQLSRSDDSKYIEPHHVDVDVDVDVDGLDCCFQIPLIQVPLLCSLFHILSV
ncbi:hypothetical protein PP707_02370 [Acetobacter pasteurianus]|nr:hypothetical protein [Acetobacter pasteurianus]